MSDQPAPHELVIVRRRGPSGEEGHHGGVWKIAYADFMTAMMAFFLVMWLVNAADKKVLTQVATYFNPLRMSDRVTARKGVEDLVEATGPKSEKTVDTQSSKTRTGSDPEKPVGGTDAKSTLPSVEPGKTGAADEGVTKKEASAASGQSHFTEQELFNDPYGILEKLAAEAKPATQGATEQGKGSADLRDGGEAFRDPFDPDFNRSRKAEAELPQVTPGQSAAKEADATAPGAVPPVTEPVGDATKVAEVAAAVERAAAAAAAASQSGKTDAKAEVGASEKENSASGATSESAPSEATHAETGPATGDGAPAAPAVSPPPADAGEAEKFERAAADLQTQLARALVDLAPGDKPSVSVKATAEGLLISLTDEFDFEMFRTSSAEPGPQLVVAMKKVGEVLKGTSGSIVVRGHTDGRPFRKGTSDNWKLSTQRALMARYMLINGGIEEKRIEHVEGYADTMLKVTTDPLAAQNRRIEIFLRAKGAA